MDTQPPSDSDQKFFPKGAIAFFIAMIIMFAVLWLSMYFEVFNRV